MLASCCGVCSSDGYGFLRLAALVCVLFVGTRRGVMRVWSGLVWTAGGSRLGNGGGDRSNEAPTGGLGTELGYASFVCLSLGPTENQSINQRSGTQYIWCIVDILAHHGMIWQLPCHQIVSPSRGPGPCHTDADVNFFSFLKGNIKPATLQILATGDAGWMGTRQNVTRGGNIPGNRRDE